MAAVAACAVASRMPAPTRKQQPQRDFDRAHAVYCKRRRLGLVLAALAAP
jgi:hypothetical protein